MQICDTKPTPAPLHIKTQITSSSAMAKNPAFSVSSFPDEVWEHIFSFLLLDSDRNSAAAVCRSFLRIERHSRRNLFIGNCYSVSPSKTISTFPEIRALRIKGKPHFADFNLVPSEWGAGALQWVREMVEGWPMLEELRMKRMVVTDECLEMIARGFRGLRVLEMVNCEGFSTSGLGSLAAGCRNLQVIDLQENEVEDTRHNWLSYFPDSFKSLVTLNIACVEGEVKELVLERIIARCPNIKTLRINHSIPLETLVSLLRKAPQLVDLGTGRFTAEHRSELFSKLESAFSSCKHLKSLSGIWDAAPAYLPAIYSICGGLTSLNLSYTILRCPELIKLICCCKNLQKLWVMDLIEDDGLAAVASSCKFLQELRVFPSNPYGGQPVSLTEQGLVTISAGCPLLHSVLYFCRQMTNSALVTIAKNRPNLTRFRLCIIEPYTPDYLTLQPLDAGFSAIVKSCKNLKRLSVSGLLTDELFKSIGTSAQKLEMLSVAFAGDSDAGLHYILSGCKSLRKLEIRDCPFGDIALLANAAKLLTMRSLWMSSCSVTWGACRLLARQMPWLNVEIIDEKLGGELEMLPDDSLVEKLYVYRTVAGKRSDIPSCVRAV